jgi:hypothetical protein
MIRYLRTFARAIRVPDASRWEVLFFDNIFSIVSGE